MERTFGDHGADCTWLETAGYIDTNPWRLSLWALEGALGANNAAYTALFVGADNAIVYLFQSGGNFQLDTFFLKFIEGAITGALAQTVGGAILNSKAFKRFFNKVESQTGSSIQALEYELFGLVPYFVRHPRKVKAWEGLFNTGLRTDIPWLTRASKWLDEGAEFAADGTGKLTKNGEDILQIKNDKILPDKFDFDPSTQKPKPGGTAIGEPSNGYQVYKHGDDLSVRRVPNEAGISPSNIPTLNGGGKGHCLHRHGADVTDDALKKRATEGRAPDGSARTKNNGTKTYLPPKSSKFNSPEKVNEALTEVGPGSSKYNAAKSAAESSGANSFCVFRSHWFFVNLGGVHQHPLSQ